MQRLFFIHTINIYVVFYRILLKFEYPLKIGTGKGKHGFNKLGYILIFLFTILNLHKKKRIHTSNIVVVNVCFNSMDLIIVVGLKENCLLYIWFEGIQTRVSLTVVITVSYHKSDIFVLFPKIFRCEVLVAIERKWVMVSLYSSQAIRKTETRSRNIS